MTTDAAPDTAPDSPSTDLRRAARRAWGALESIHVLGYFAPEVAAEYTALGLRPNFAYFAARSAAFGPVGPEVPAATFYVFAPWLFAKTLPSSWELASPERVQQARRDGMAVVLEQVIGSQDVTELLDLAKVACAGLTAPGRALYAAHAGLDWPTEPRLALWHAATLLREHRGDGHVAVLLGAGLGPVESLILGGLFAGNTEFLRSTRGWTPQEWDDAQSRLTDRGLVDADGLTEAGLAFRKDLEHQTDQLALEGWAHLGLEGTQRALELAGPLSARVAESGVLPSWTRKQR